MVIRTNLLKGVNEEEKRDNWENENEDRSENRGRIESSNESGRALEKKVREKGRDWWK